jgi:hypothetical protein
MAIVNMAVQMSLLDADSQSLNYILNDISSIFSFVKNPHIDIHTDWTSLHFYQ